MVEVREKLCVCPYECALKNTIKENKHKLMPIEPIWGICEL